MKLSFEPSTLKLQTSCHFMSLLAGPERALGRVWLGNWECIAA